MGGGWDYITLRKKRWNGITRWIFYAEHLDRAGTEMLPHIRYTFSSWRASDGKTLKSEYLYPCVFLSRHKTHYWILQIITLHYKENQLKVGTGRGTRAVTTAVEGDASPNTAGRELCAPNELLPLVPSWSIFRDAPFRHVLTLARSEKEVARSVPLLATPVVSSSSAHVYQGSMGWLKGKSHF